MAKKKRNKEGLWIKIGEKIKITRDTFVKNPRKGKKLEDVKKRDEIEKKRKSKKESSKKTTKKTRKYTKKTKK